MIHYVLGQTARNVAKLLNYQQYLFVLALLHFVMGLSLDELQHFTASINYCFVLTVSFDYSSSLKAP